MELFGFTFKRKDQQPELPSFSASKETDDGALVVSAGGAYGTMVDLDGTVRSEAELVTKYREMSLNPECDSAIDEIVNESIAVDAKKLVKIDLDELKVSEQLKSIIREEFDTCLRLVEFNRYAYEIYRRWYIDGRLYYHVVIDEQNPTEGIKELRYIDPRKIRKVREVQKKRAGQNLSEPILTKVVNEYYIYNDKGFNFGNKSVGANTTGLKIAADSIIHVVSGLTDNQGSIVLSYLHKAIKALNQLSTLEDALVIYRLSRAPERRIWYIDVGNLPKMKAEQYVREIMVKHKNRLIYDAATGSVRDDRKFMTLLEDYWLPRREGGRGTEVTTLPGGCLAMDTKVPLLDGRELSIAEIEKEMEEGKVLWTYSCNPVTGKVVPGIISWAGITQKSAQVMKLTFNNGETLICTPDHKFPVLNKNFVRADELSVNENVFNFSTKETRLENFIFDDLNKTWELSKNEKVSENTSSHSIVVKISKIEYLDEEIPVGTLTIDQEELYHDYHTFALSCGIFTKNSNLGQMDDVLYFQKKFLQTLNVPVSRLNSDALFSIGRATEITRDELKFERFITRLRSRFSHLFIKMLEKQLVLKGITTIEDWQSIQSQIKFDFAKDNYFAELKEAEMLQNRIMQTRDMQDMAGKYVSHSWIRKNILQQSEDEVAMQDYMIGLENQSGDPRWVNPMIMQNEQIAQQDQPAAGTSEQQDGAEDETRDKMAQVSSAITFVRLMKEKGIKNRTSQEQSKYKAAVQIIAKNPEITQKLGIPDK